MKNYQKILGSGLALLLLLGMAEGVWATLELTRDYFKNHDEIMAFQKDHRVDAELYGDIIKIGPDQMALRTNGASCVLKISTSARIYCNGYHSYWEALRPVSQGAYFEARVYLDARGEAILINGFYYGEEGIIQSYQWVDHRLQLELYHPQNGKKSYAWVSEQAALPEVSDWLRNNQAIYVLYDVNGEIRRVFLA